MRSWYLLIHSIPPKPLYLRAKVRQRLERIGAVALKKSVYVLPEREDCLEDFQWLSGEITAGGGDAFIVAARTISGVTDDELIHAFQTASDASYAALIEELRGLERQDDARSRRLPPEEQRGAVLARLRRRLAEIQAVDHFEAPKGAEAEDMLEKLERKQLKRPAVAATEGRPSGATWVTRRGIKIDRIASAWLVRRYIDPTARFRFVDPERFEKREGEIAFDMKDGDYTHEGDRCTFETLLRRFSLKEPALRRIGEIVHDIDLKDARYGRAEASGVAQLIDGLVSANPGDEQRLERGFAIFDDLHSGLESKRRAKK